MLLKSILVALCLPVVTISSLKKSDLKLDPKKPHSPQLTSFHPLKQDGQLNKSTKTEILEKDQTKMTPQDKINKGIKSDSNTGTKNHTTAFKNFVQENGPRQKSRKNNNRGKEFSENYENNYYGENQQFFSPTWTSLDSRKLPVWYDEAKFGIFVHWGVYSVPGVLSEWFWYHWKVSKWANVVNYMARNYPPGFKYADFGTQFKAQLFNASEWYDLVARSGAKYFVFTSKHHEGFANWNTSYSWNWNSVDIGPHRDIVGELTEAFRNQGGVRFGLYFSLYEWFNPLYLKDKRNNFTTQNFVQTTVVPQLMELVNKYQPEYIWSDGDWEAPDTYWDSKQFLAWLYNESPVATSVVVNDRWGVGCSCKHGDVHVCEDKYNPGELRKHKWENAMSINKQSWGFTRDGKLEDYLSIHDLIRELASTVSCGGNLLMNIGPSPDGTIPLIFKERLQQMGDWLQVNGEAIYGSKPWKAQNDSINPNVWYTTKDGNVYAITLEWPRSGRLVLGAPIPSQDTTVTMLGLMGEFSWWIIFDPLNKFNDGSLNISATHNNGSNSKESNVKTVTVNTHNEKASGDGSDGSGNYELEEEEEEEGIDEQNGKINNSNTRKNTNRGNYALAIDVPPVAISALPSNWAWVFKFTHVL